LSKVTRTIIIQHVVGEEGFTIRTNWNFSGPDGKFTDECWEEAPQNREKLEGALAAFVDQLDAQDHQHAAAVIESLQSIFDNVNLPDSVRMAAQQELEKYKPAEAAATT
jgi:hypothetical protein